MRKPGRTSKAALEVIEGGPPSTVEAVERPQPPQELTDDEAGVWSDVVDSLPADWFAPHTFPLLAQYCRHSIQAIRVAALIEQATSGPDVDVAQLQQLQAMQRAQTAALSSIATKLRMTPQATTNHRGNKARAPMVKPWEG